MYGRGNGAPLFPVFHVIRRGERGRSDRDLDTSQERVHGLAGRVRRRNDHCRRNLHTRVARRCDRLSPGPGRNRHGGDDDECRVVLSYPSRGVRGPYGARLAHRQPQRNDLDERTDSGSQHRFADPARAAGRSLACRAPTRGRHRPGVGVSRGAVSPCSDHRSRGTRRRRHLSGGTRRVRGIRVRPDRSSPR